MKINRIENIKPAPDDIVTIKQCGKIIELRYMTAKSRDCPIIKLNADYYVNKSTGEVCGISHKHSRISDKASVSQSLARLRDLINCNLTNPHNALWVTLTYAENMTDTKLLYEDYRKFWQRLCYYLKKHGHPKAEYIIAAEPQARGAWHLHCIFLWNKKAPFIPNEDMARMWLHGFTKTQSLYGIDNVGLYLTAYLGDMELSEAFSAGVTTGRSISEIETKDGQGNIQKKAVIKGARLALYPTAFNIYRASRGIKRPRKFTTTEKNARKIIGNAPQVYEKTIAITDDADEVKNIINYRQYNLAKKE